MSNHSAVSSFLVFRCTGYVRASDAKHEFDVLSMTDKLFDLACFLHLLLSCYNRGFDTSILALIPGR